jgi:hypothetical protein
VPDPRPSRYALVAEATSAGLLFVLAPGVGFFAGRGIGTVLHLGPVPSWVGAALGLVFAFAHLVRLTGRASR